MANFSKSNNNVVVITGVAKNLPKNPLLNPDLRTTAPASIRSASSANSNGVQSYLSHRVLFHDQRCFLTGSLSGGIQACHLVNAIRTKNRPGKVNLKRQVEFILTRQGFNGRREFFLDSLVNCVGLDVHWHGELDIRGSFCITVPLKQIFEIATALTSENINWEHRVVHDPKAKRNLDTTQYPFVVREVVVLVIHPKLFLADNQPIIMNTQRSLRPVGQTIPDSTARESWKMYYPQQNGPYLQDAAGSLLMSLEFKTNRTQDTALSVFSLLLNADAKLQELRAEGLPAETFDALSLYKIAVASAVERIFFLPKDLQDAGPFPNGEPGTAVGGVEDTSPTNSMNVDARGGGNGGESMNIDGRGGGNDADGLLGTTGVDCEDEFDYESESESGESESMEPDQLKRTVGQVSDGTLPGTTRAQAARALLMTRPAHHNPLSPLLV
ncbi:hypothetical protein DFH07DRAFT_815391 [Mycena maculata]|uniref:Uncharacterized protein n=1 Tax=Mycena maculata TaxID=230809 RepID=A0AAD7JFA0_9AGAR|nr:hypothetical protein DFH07DRAFT_815391 [Mycena maculata]